jgi:DNA-directed RNA polymerase specialized sigma subunit
MSKEQDLIREFHEATAQYAALAKAYEDSIRDLTQRRRDIVHELVRHEGARHSRTYKTVADMLGISTARVGQLVRESSLYDDTRPTAA